MIANGTIIKEAILEELATEVEGKAVRVCFLQYGNDIASSKFVSMKMKTAELLGIQAEHVVSQARTTEEALRVLEEVITDEYDGIVLQLPVPRGLDADVLIEAIPVAMDIDVLSSAALEAFSLGKSMRMPPVAAAVELLLNIYQVQLQGKHIVIRGKGKLVGDPLMRLFDRNGIVYRAIDATTSEEDQLAVLIDADIIISGIGVPYSLTPDMIKEGVILIDAGTSEQGGKLAGDIDPACADKAALYTPVPGGVGPITVACLFRNVFL